MQEAVRRTVIRRDDQAPCPASLSADDRRGDTLIVWKLDRLGRSLHDLITMLDDLKQRGVRFQSLTEAIDTETRRQVAPCGR